jgi:hypothetical protein
VGNDNYSKEVRSNDLLEVIYVCFFLKKTLVVRFEAVFLFFLPALLLSFPPLSLASYSLGVNRES